MGFFEKNMEKMRTDMAAAKVQYHEQINNLFFVCPKCMGTMKEPMRFGALFRTRIVRCIECGYEMEFRDAQRELKHPIIREV